MLGEITSRPFPSVVDEKNGCCEKCAFGSGRHAPHCKKFVKANFDAANQKVMDGINAVYAEEKRRFNPLVGPAK